MKIQPGLLAIDQGTTSTRAIVFDASGRACAVAQQDFTQHYPANGWVEHIPEALWTTTVQVSRQALQQAEAKGIHVAAIGITNQRETTLVWDKSSGTPLYNAIVWQDRRTADYCLNLKDRGCESEIQQRSGLLLDPYFSASKITWILNHVDGAKERALKGRLAFGTVDSFLIWRFTGGKVHASDITNASRSSLFNIHTQTWDPELLALFDIPAQMLPEVHDCTHYYGDTETSLFGRAIPILGVAGDQQAAAIGQCCFNTGDIKSTYGTGCFILVNTGQQAVQSHHRLLSTIAYRIQNQTCYALEGSIFIAGAAIQWLRDSLGIIQSATETEHLAQSTEDNGGVYLVPAFTGLGAPYWEPHARGALTGLTRNSGRAILARAALESVCYQSNDLINAIKEEGIQPTMLKVDGGMTANSWFLQYLANVLNITVERPAVMETTALGAAYLAGLQLGLYQNCHALCKLWQRNAVFEPKMGIAEREHAISGWQQAIARVLS